MSEEVTQKTYRNDLYYVNYRIIGTPYRYEEVVPVWKFYLTWLFNPLRFKKYKMMNVLYEY